MIYIILTATIPITVTIADTSNLPMGYIDSKLKCEEIDEKYHNSYSPSGNKKFWCNNNQDLFSWTCLSDNTDAGSLYIKRCLDSCDTDDDIAIVESQCKSSISSDYLVKRLSYDKELECPLGIGKDSLSCNENNEISQICLSKPFEQDDKKYLFLFKECNCISNEGICEEDIMPGEDNGFDMDLTQANEEIEKCLEDPDKCKENIDNNDCTLQDRINYLCRYGPDGEDDYNPPSGNWDNPGYPDCNYNINGDPIGFTDPDLDVRDELNWLANKREFLKKIENYNPDIPLNLENYPGFLGTNTCSDSSKTTVERTLNDCRVIRVFVSNGEIDYALECTPDVDLEVIKSIEDCPPIEDEEKQCNEITNYADLDEKALDAFYDILSTEDLVPPDDPLFDDYKRTCDESIVITTNLENNQNVQVFDAFDEIKFEIIFDSTSSISSSTDNQEDTNLETDQFSISDEEREIEISLFNEDTGEQTIPLLENKVMFIDGIAKYTGSFVPKVTGAYTLNVRIYDKNGECVAKQRTYSQGSFANLLVFSDNEEEIRIGLNELLGSKRIEELERIDSEYTEAFKRFLKARSKCYRSENFKGYGSPLDFCKDSELEEYKESFKNYIEQYAKSNMGEEQQKQFLEAINEPDVFKNAINTYEKNIRNDVIKYYLEASITNTQLALGITENYRQILLEDSVGIGASGLEIFFTSLTNPFKYLLLIGSGKRTEKYFDGLKRSDEKLFDIEQSFLILKSSLYGQPLLDPGEFAPPEDNELAQKIENLKKNFITGQVIDENNEIQDKSWSTIYNSIKYISDDCQVNCQEIRDELGIAGISTQEEKEDAVIKALGFSKEISFELNADYPDKDSRDKEVGKNKINSLIKSVNTYAPSVPLFKAINEENAGLILFGYGWLDYFVIMESMGGWTENEDNEFRGIFEDSALKTYQNLLDKYPNGAGKGPFWHDKIYGAKKSMLTEIAGRQWASIIELNEKDPDYSKELQLAMDGQEKIKKNIGTINLLQIADFVIGAIGGIIVGNWMFGAISKVGTMFKFLSDMPFIAKFFASESRFARVLTGAGRFAKGTVMVTLLFGGLGVTLLDIGNIFGECKTAFDNPDETMSSEEKYVEELKKKSEKGECVGRTVQMLMFIVGPLALERYGGKWAKIGRESHLGGSEDVKFWDWELMVEDFNPKGNNLAKQARDTTRKLRSSWKARKSSAGLSFADESAIAKADDLLAKVKKKQDIVDEIMSNEKMTALQDEQHELLEELIDLRRQRAENYYLNNLKPSELKRMNEENAKKIGIIKDRINEMLNKNPLYKQVGEIEYEIFGLQIEYDKLIGQFPSQTTSAKTNRLANRADQVLQSVKNRGGSFSDDMVEKLTKMRNRIVGGSRKVRSVSSNNVDDIISRLVRPAKGAVDDIATQFAMLRKVAMQGGQGSSKAINGLARIAIETSDDAIRQGALRQLFDLSVQNTDEIIRSAARKQMRGMRNQLDIDNWIYSMENYFEARVVDLTGSNMQTQLSGNAEALAGVYRGKLRGKVKNGIAEGYVALEGHGNSVNIPKGWDPDYFRLYKQNNQDAIGIFKGDIGDYILVLDEVSTPQHRDFIPGEGNVIFFDAFDKAIANGIDFDDALHIASDAVIDRGQPMVGVGAQVNGDFIDFRYAGDPGVYRLKQNAGWEQLADPEVYKNAVGKEIVENVFGRRESRVTPIQLIPNQNSRIQMDYGDVFFLSSDWYKSLFNKRPDLWNQFKHRIDTQPIEQVSKWLSDLSVGNTKDNVAFFLYKHIP